MAESAGQIGSALTVCFNLSVVFSTFHLLTYSYRITILLFYEGCGALRTNETAAPNCLSGLTRWAWCLPLYPNRTARESASPHHGHFNQTFVDQLRRVFGAFRDADLQRVFDSARPIRCSDLVGDTGEWREVAFFNEYRDFGGWYRTSLDDVRADLSTYIFRGRAQHKSSNVQVITKFPVAESVNAYEARSNQCSRH